MSNIKSGTSNISFNYNTKGVGPLVGQIIANVSNETVTNTKHLEAESVDLSNVTEVQESISYEDANVSLETPEKIKEDIATIEGIVDQLEEEVNSIPTYSEYSYHDLVDAGLVNARDDANAKRDELNTYITQLKYLKKEYEKKLNYLKYDEIASTDKYNEFVSNYDINYQNIDFQLFSECGYDIDQYLMKLYGSDYKNHDIDPLAIAENYVNANKDNENFDMDRYAREFDRLSIKVGDETINAFDFYNYSSEEQQKMYHYIFANEGSEQANEYLKLIVDDINRNKGFAMACDYTNTLMLDEENIAKNLVDLLSVNSRGLGDGIDTFFEGIEQAVKNDGTLSASDYEKMFVLQYLQENTDVLDEYYTFFNTAGNMVPSMLASTAISIIATPAAGSIAASTLMGLSAGGNAKHDALVNGANTLEANLYAIVNGSSEALLGYFLGKIPGISKESELSIKALFQEGAEEFSQEWLDAGFRAAILGEDIDLSQVSGDSAKSFLMGIAMAGFLNGGQQVLNVAINGETIEIDSAKLLEYMNEHPTATVDEVLEYLYPKAIMDYEYSNEYIHDAETDAIMNSTKAHLDKLINEEHLDMEKVIYSELQNAYTNAGSTIKEQRYTARAIVEYLINNGYTPYAATNIVGQIGMNMLNDIGYSTYFDESSNTSFNFLNSYDINTNTIPSEVIDAFNKLPPELQDSVNNINLYDTYNPYDFYWEMEYNMNNFDSHATGGQGVINVWNSITDINHTISHESAHSYDTKYAEDWGLKKGERISQSKIWLDAMKADEALNNLNGVSEYARKSGSSVEDFADAVALYIEDPSSLDQFPNRKALLEQHLSKIQSTNTNMDIDLVDISKKIVFQGYTSEQLAEILRTKSASELIELTKNVNVNSKEYQGWLYDNHREDITNILMNRGFSESEVSQLYENFGREEILQILQDGKNATNVNYTTQNNQNNQNVQSIFTSDKQYSSTDDLLNSIQSVDPINNYEVMDQLAKSLTTLAEQDKLNYDSTYSTIVHWNNNSSYELPSQQTTNNYWNKILNPSNIVQYQTGWKEINSVEQFNQLNRDNNFVHVKSRDFGGCDSRLYLNIDLESAYKILPEFIDKCNEQGIPYYFKTAGYSGGDVYKESNFTRDETIVIYSSEGNEYKYVNILKEIMANDSSIKVEQSPILTSTIDGVIGYSDDPLIYKNITADGHENYSFNSLRAEVITNAYKNLINKYGLDNIKAIESKGGTEYNQFLNEFYNEIHKVGADKGIDTHNFSLNDSSLISPENQYLLKNKNANSNNYQVKSVNLSSTDYSNMSQQLANAYNTTKAKYGKDVALQRMQKYIESGNINYITSDGRKGMTYSIEAYREYVKKSSNGTLNIYNIFR